MGINANIAIFVLFFIMMHPIVFNSIEQCFLFGMNKMY